VLAVLLAGIAVVLYATDSGDLDSLGIDGVGQVIAGVAAGFCIGVVASVMGVAGGELLIPTLVLLFGVHIKLAGSLSLAVSLPTMIVAFARYSRDGSFVILRRHRRFVALMALGSVGGSLLGGLLVDVVSEDVIVPALVTILAISAVKVWRHEVAATAHG
jgi:uncharacterized membrane protein YfcA